LKGQLESIFSRFSSFLSQRFVKQDAFFLFLLVAFPSSTEGGFSFLYKGGLSFSFPVEASMSHIGGSPLPIGYMLTFVVFSFSKMIFVDILFFFLPDADPIVPLPLCRPYIGTLSPLLQRDRLFLSPV